MMKNFTQEIKVLCGFVFIMFITSTSIAQVTHQVTVQDMSFTPANLEINVGDMVVWSNIGGIHNVNGTTATYPDNPESFGNDPATAPWTYSFTFTEEGEYEYRCDVHPAMMLGTITVMPSVGIAELSTEDQVIRLYGESIRIIAPEKVNKVILYNVTGQKVISFPGSKGEYSMDNSIPQGIYIAVAYDYDGKAIQYIKLFNQ